MKKLKFFIHRFLTIQHAGGSEWVAGGIIEDHLRSNHPNHPKGETTSRVLRFMADKRDYPEGHVHLLTIQYDKEGNVVKKGNVFYRINPEYGKVIPAKKVSVSTSQPTLFK